MRSKTSKKRKAPSALLHVAVVLRVVSNLNDGLIHSGRNKGDWGSFIGVEKAEVVTAALKARADWERSGAYGPYRIMTGTLTEEIITPTNYRVVKIKRGTLLAGE